MSNPESPSLKESTLTNQFLTKLLREQYDPDVEVVTFDVQKKGRPGDNCMSLIYNLNLKIRRRRPQGTVREEEEDGRISLILKTLPANFPVLKCVRDLKSFEREGAMYQNVFPELLSVDNGYNSLPKCYSAGSINEQSAYLLMENLTEKGFKTLDRITGLDLDHAVLAISELAKFHAISFVKYKGNGEVILERYPELVDMFWVAPDKVPPETQEYITNTVAGINQVLKEENKEHLIKRVERHFQNVFEKMYRKVGIPDRFPSVVNFGDCWTNNLMFHYDEQGKPESVKFLDFQLARVTSRCYDLAYLLFTSINMDVLNFNFEKLLRTYHESFNNLIHFFHNDEGNNLPRFNAQELSWEYFNTEFEQYRSVGTTMSLILTPLMLTSSEPLADDLDKTSKADLQELARDDYANSWKCKAVREKLIAIASGHLPMCFKPAQY